MTGMLHTDHWRREKDCMNSYWLDSRWNDGDTSSLSRLHVMDENVLAPFVSPLARFVAFDWNAMYRRSTEREGLEEYHWLHFPPGIDRDKVRLRPFAYRERKYRRLH